MHRRLEKRIAFLTCAETLIRRIGESIRYTAAPVGDTLAALANGSEFGDFSLLSDTVAGLAPDGEFRYAWHTAVSAHAARWELTPRETAVLYRYADGLGVSDVSGEMRHSERCAQELHDCILARREDMGRRGRLYPILGVCMASATALLLL